MPRGKIWMPSSTKTELCLTLGYPVSDSVPCSGRAWRKHQGSGALTLLYTLFRVLSKTPSVASH